MAPLYLTVEATGTVNQMKLSVCVCGMEVICYSSDREFYYQGNKRKREWLVCTSSVSSWGLCNTWEAATDTVKPPWLLIRYDWWCVFHIISHNYCTWLLLIFIQFINASLIITIITILYFCSTFHNTEAQNASQRIHKTDNKATVSKQNKTKHHTHMSEKRKTTVKLSVKYHTILMLVQTSSCALKMSTDQPLNKWVMLFTPKSHWHLH